jgi:hypothetical protein
MHGEERRMRRRAHLLGLRQELVELPEVIVDGSKGPRVTPPIGKGKRSLHGRQTSSKDIE